MKQRIIIFAVSLLFIISCRTKSESNSESDTTTKASQEMEVQTPDFQISLAQWSFHKAFLGPQKEGYWEWFVKTLQESPDDILLGSADPKDFPEMAAKFGVSSIELVNTFYYGKVDDQAFWNDFKKRCEEAGLSVGLIMCDALGNLGDADPEARKRTVENHHKWVDIAKFLGAHSIRVNAAGEGSAEEVASNAVDGLKQLGEYGAAQGINIIVENHGGYSSNGAWLAGIMAEVNMDNVGTLPDYGNFCIERSSDGCADEYDRYKGMAELMPYAKGVSAKSHDFDENGNETHTDFYKMLKIVKDSGFKGYIGIEYEGNVLSEEEGIEATYALLNKAIDSIQ
ncbi:sugar phosphate isomerase/epimerase family protein [uncultured Allomuricauda sp.]|uniref:sugar phosphate isomerase/epimerase family protein n=1 Tax=Flagellimonas sp. W118 TaxID=3410791 RepID=UPI00263415F8|nr:sugar phosphate isomerase/epimerase family protein [uncultured Allomuricauda sp.]